MRRALVVGLVLLLAPATAVPAPASDAPAVAERHARIRVVDGPADDQHVELDLTLFVPDTATRDDPAPAVVLTHGFGGRKEDVFRFARATARAGFVVVAYSSRGFGASSGGIGMASVQYDVKDASQLIDWIAAQPEVLLDGKDDPRVGWSGESYGGGISLMVASRDPRVDAIAPRITWSSLVSALSPNWLGPTPAPDRDAGVFKQQWTSYFFFVGSGQPLTSPGPDAPVGADRCGGFVLAYCRAFHQTVAAGEAPPDVVALMRESSPTTYASGQPGLRRPTLLVQGQADTLFPLNESLRLFEILERNGAPAKLVWFSGGHSASAVPGDRARVEQLILDWWRRWLRGEASVDTGPTVEWYRPWVATTEASVGAAYASAEGYPVHPPTRLALGGDGTLVSAGRPVEAGSVTLVTPPGGVPAAYSETSAAEGRYVHQPPREVPGQHASWETAPLEAPAELVGMPVLSGLRLSSRTGEAVLFAKLYEVAPDGSVTLLRRMVAPVRAPELSAPLTVTLPALVHRFDAGSRIRLVLATTDSAYGNRRVPDAYTLTLDPAAPATLDLPLDRAAARQAPPEPATAPGELPATGLPAAVPLAAVGLLALAGLALGAARRHRG